MIEINLTDFLLASAAMLRRLIWLLVTIFIIKSLWKTFHHQRSDTSIIPGYMVIIFIEFSMGSFLCQNEFFAETTYTYWWVSKFGLDRLLLFLLIAVETINLLLTSTLFNKQLTVSQISNLVFPPECCISIRCVQKFRFKEARTLQLFHGPCSELPPELLDVSIESWKIQNEEFVLQIPIKEFYYIAHLQGRISDDAYNTLLSIC